VMRFWFFGDLVGEVDAARFRGGCLPERPLRGAMVVATLIPTGFSHASR
jgi:hypothetical protein